MELGNLIEDAKGKNAQREERKAEIPAIEAAGPATEVFVASGNNQAARRGTRLHQQLLVLVTDQHGNAVSGNAVTFSDGGAGGIFSNTNPVTPGPVEQRPTFIRCHRVPGTVTINATATEVSSPTVFTETSQ
jgi:hypothetical protein